MENVMLTLSFVTICWVSLSLAHEPTPLQDFCVADLDTSVRVNGFPCIDPKLVTADHFLFRGLHIPGNTSNIWGVSVNRPTVDQIPGLNTLGISTVRVDYAPQGVVPPHCHPRAAEILTVLEGSVLAGFVTSDPENRLVSKVLQKGDVFVFPFGLVHFQQNVGRQNAVTMGFLSSQNPGVVIVSGSVFGSKPPLEDDVLAKAFRVDNSIIDEMKAPWI